MKKILVILLISLFFTHRKAEAQLIIDQSYGFDSLISHVLLDTGMIVSNASYQGLSNSTGSDQISRFINGNTTSLGISEGIVLCSGKVTDIVKPASAFLSYQLGMPGNSLLQIVGGGTSYDAAIAEFDLIPFADTLRFHYVFGSEEYPEWAGSGYNDVFAFFLSGPNPSGGDYLNFNIALIPGTNTPVSINSVSPLANTQYYIDNSADTTIVFDGITTVLSVSAAVVPCASYHLTIGVCDINDAIYDSGVFIEAGSLYTDFLTFSLPGSSDTIILYSTGGAVPVTLHLPSVISYDKVVRFSATNSSMPVQDIITIPDSVVIAAGNSEATFYISPVNSTDTLERIITIITQEPSCAMDTLVVKILHYNAMVADILLSNSGGQNCFNDVVFCKCNVTGGVPPYTIQWSNGTIADSTVWTICSLSEYIYVTITDSYTSVNDSILITGQTEPYAEFTTSDTVLLPGETVYFHNLSTVYSWLQWDFGDNNYSFLSLSEHAYSDTGQYLVTLIVSNACGNDTAYQNISVIDTLTVAYYSEKPTLEVIPNPFKDQFMLLVPSLIEISEILIFNELGQEQKVMIEYFENNIVVKGLLNKGIYFVVLTVADKVWRIPVLKE